MSKHMPNKVSDEIMYPFLNAIVVLLKLKNVLSDFIPHFIIDILTYLRQN